MSKKLNKLVDINRLREFKNKLVGTDSAYVQTGAVDQTVAGTKTFSELIVGSVTGSSGSCTGNAATATTATTAKACTGNAATATKLATARSLWGNDFDGSAAITGGITGTPSIEFEPLATTSNNGGYLDFHYNQSTADYTSRIIESASGTLSINNVTITTGKVVTATTFNGALTGNVTGNCSGSSGSCTGNAATATKAVSADSATNASHATSADKATKAEQDGNGNNIVASYVAAGTEDSTTDIGAFMSARPSFIKSFTYNDVWTDAISIRHRNGSGDGNLWGTYIRSSNMTGVSNLLWNHEYGGNWQGERTLIDSANLAGFVKSGITIYDLVPDGAANHCNFYRGKDLTAAFNAGTVSANIANGTFRDIFPGDYITKSVTISGTAYTIKFVIADLDIWLHRGDTPCETHHVAIVPEVPPFSSYMNAENVTTGGYVGSYMNKTVMPAFATGLQNAFGASHLISFRYLESNTVNTSVPSAGYTGWTGASQWTNTWASYTCRLLNETTVYGSSIFASSGEDERMGGVQMAAFRLNSNLVYNRQNYWLSDVVSSAVFARVNGAGNAGTNGASDSYGVRPFALLR